MSQPTNHGSEPPPEQPYGRQPGGNEQGQPPYGSQPPHGSQPHYGPQPPYGQQQQPPYGQPPYGQPPYGPPGQYPAARPPLTPADERTWAVIAHIGPPVITVLTAGTLFFLVPLVVWLVYRDRSGFVNDHAKESLNFQLTLLIAYVIGVVTLWVLIGILVLVTAFVLAVIFGIQAALAANRHEPYRYPMSIRFIS